MGWFHCQDNYTSDRFGTVQYASDSTGCLQVCKSRSRVAVGSAHGWHLCAGFLVASLVPDGIFIMWMLGTLFTLPVYAGFTALKTRRVDEEPTPFPYFRLWNVLACTSIDLGYCNVDWEKTPVLLGIFIVAVPGLLDWSVMEIPRAFL